MIRVVEDARIAFLIRSHSVAAGKYSAGIREFQFLLNTLAHGAE
jgi:hypothetical protein